MQTFDIVAGAAPAAFFPPISPRTPVTYRPEATKETPEAGPAYLVRPPTFRTRANAEHEAMPLILRSPGDAEMNRAAAACVERVVKEDDRAGVREALAAFQALLDNPEQMKDDETARIEVIAAARRIHAQLTPYDGAMQRIVADRVFAASLQNFYKVRHHLAGWSGVSDGKGGDIAFIAGPDGLASEETLSRIPSVHVQKLAAFIDTLTAPDKATEKN